MERPLDHISETQHLIEENVQDAPVKDVHWNVNQIDTASETHLEDDEGYGSAAIIRRFEFGMNPEAFKIHTPTRQELFNHHIKGIEIMLWRDGMRLMTEVEPRLVMNEKAGKYYIFIGAKPAKGHILQEQPKKLTELIHGR